MKSSVLIIGLGAVFLTTAGCNFSPPPDPNDPTQVSIQQPKVMMRRLKWASNAANMRVAQGEISEQKAKELVSQSAKGMISAIPQDMIPHDQAWEYAEVFRTAKDYESAVKFFKIAVENAATEDRKINDTLRYAHCLAETGQVKEAIEMAKSTFTAPDTDTAPVLPSILYEIAPAARGKGHNKELSDLLYGAVRVFERTIVDKDSEAGAMFLMARPTHIKKAISLAQELSRQTSNKVSLLMLHNG